MSLLVPDYASSSEDEAVSGTSVPAAASALSPTVINASPSRSSSSTVDVSTTSKQQLQPTRKKRKRKPKKTLYLPPEIQRLLEKGTSGGAFSDDSDEDSELLVKLKQAKKAARSRPQPAANDKDSILSFLPSPKHELSVPEHEINTAEAEVVEEQGQVETHEVTGAYTDQQTGAAANAPAWQQQQEQYHANLPTISHEYYVAQGEDDVSGGSSKRRRTRERDIERALQEGHLDTVAGQIVDVQGPSPNTWQPSDDPSNGSSDQVVKVKASFWNPHAGTKVSTIKPSRLQRQKHQLNQLAFDAQARDLELQEKRSAASKTKRETYAKYGW